MMYGSHTRVFHFSGPTFSRVKVVESSIKEFEESSFLHELFSVDRKKKFQFCDKEVIKFSGNKIFERASGCLGMNLGGYSLLKNNCEHFANWCVQGRLISNQIFWNPDQGKNLPDERKEASEETELSLLELLKKILFPFPFPDPIIGNKVTGQAMKEAVKEGVRPILRC